MAIRIGINGFGRIGRCVGRIMMQDPNLELVAVNDLATPEQLAYLFKYDSVHRKYPGSVEVGDGTINIDGKSVKVLSERDPSKLPWGELGVDYVIESTGLFRDHSKAKMHLDAGAKFVLVSAPGKGLDLSVVYGVNHEKIDTKTMKIIDVASCTTNCLAPVAKVLNDTFGIESGLMTTVHAYTADQVLLDAPHKDFRRGRAAAANMVPTSTGAAIAVSRVIPELEGKLNGMAVRVPTTDVSLIDLVCEFKKPVTVEAINDALRKAAKSDSFKGVLAVIDEPVVSSDQMGDPHSSVVDAELTMVIGDKLGKVVSWYDNEWGFSNRMVDVLRYVAQKSK